MFTFDEAQKAHSVVSEAADVYVQKGEKDRGEEVWRGIVTAEDLTPDSVAEVLRITMPVDALPLVRARSSVAASFVFERFAHHLDTLGDPFQEARAAWKDFAERKRLANNVEEGYGCDKSPSWELARDIVKNHDVRKIERIAELAGRMYQAMQGARKVPTDLPQEVRGVTVGGEVERLVASELAQLADPGLSDQAAIRILEKRAQQYKMRGMTSASRGPLVICLDESGSMHDDNYCGRNSWAKSCALALTRIAHEGNRMVSVVHFGTATSVTKCVPGDAKALLDMSRHFLSGGTDIARALAVSSVEVGELDKLGYVGADIVVVTDGEDGNYQAMHNVLNLVQAQGVRLWTVAIECQIHEHSPLVQRAEEVIRVAETQRADMVADLRRAAENLVSEEDRKAAEQRRKLLN